MVGGPEVDADALIAGAAYLAVGVAVLLVVAVILWREWRRAVRK